MQVTPSLTYTDSFEHAFDEKGRITVPKEWRGDGFESVLHVIPSEQKCLKVYPASFLAGKQAKLESEGAPVNDPRRQALEKLASVIQQVSPDTNHRISIKEKYRQHAGLGKTAALVGKFDHFEIWNSEAWAAQSVSEITLEEAAALAGF